MKGGKYRYITWLNKYNFELLNLTIFILFSKLVIPQASHE